MTRKLPSIEELLALGCEGVSEDSREIQPGYLFVALKGANESGIDYVKDAMDRGAKFILSAEKLRPNLLLLEGVQSFVHNEPRRCLAKLAKHFCGQVPRHLFGVTGTSGKTSCSIFAVQLLRNLKHRAVYAGTLGFDIGSHQSSALLQGEVVHPSDIEQANESGSLTSERACVLYSKLHSAYKRGLSYAVIEASSIGLEQSRLDGLTFEVGALTTFGDDHLASHGSLDAYKQAKLLLFRRNLVKGGAVVVGRGLKDWILADGDKFNVVTMDGDNPDFGYKVISKGARFSEVEVTLPYKGVASGLAREPYTAPATWQTMPNLQYDNLIVAMAMLSVSGLDPASVVASSQHVTGIRGRFEEVARSQDGKRIMVDYAHNAHSLEHVLVCLRKELKGDGRLHVVFGAGGNRDVGRRAGMGKVAQRFADEIIVTDDNPRNEDPQTIRQEIMAHAGPKARAIAPREAAIFNAVGGMKADDILLIAGKGDEDTTIGEMKIPFDDRSYALDAFNQCYPAEAKPFHVPYLFSKTALAALYGKPFLKSDNESAITGVSLDTRTLREGDIFFAIKGERHDGHKYIFDALQKGASAIVATDLDQLTMPCNATVFKVEDSLEGLWDIARFARREKIKKVVGITGSVGKTSSRQAIDVVVSQMYRRYASRGNLNNHFGVPLSLARTPYSTEIGIYETGIDSPEEMPPISQLLSPDIAVFTSFAPAHTRRLGDTEGVIKAKLQLLAHMKEGSDVLLPSEAFDYPQFFEVLQQHLQTYKDKFRFRFLGHGDKATDRIVETEQVGENLIVRAELMGERRTNFTMKTVGAHWALTGLIGLVVGDLLSVPLETSARSLALFSADKGRGKLLKTATVNVIDHSYNASPASMKAAIDSLVSMDIPESGNRFAVLGDMEDLGNAAHLYHVRVLEYASTTNIAGCFLVGGRFSKALDSCREISRQRFVDHKGDYRSLANILRSFLSEDDILMVKGSRKCYLDTLIAMLT